MLSRKSGGGGEGGGADGGGGEGGRGHLFRVGWLNGADIHLPKQRTRGWAGRDAI